MSLVLVTDSSGMPREWADMQTACLYYAKNKVLYPIGNQIKEFVGGRNSEGETSRIAISSIIVVSGPVLGKEFLEKETVYTERSVLYSRDHHMCAYCGDVFSPKDLTIDHVTPKSRGGKNTWMNTVAACKPCNLRKGSKTPEEAKMHLLYVPYRPTRQEKILLKNKKILADQMEFLLARIPKNSRVWTNRELFKH
jgi:CRISPR/Cas system Type II protein with McrA/HNH and RuvC-like nuclease domain